MATYGRVRSTRLLVIGLLLASLVTITVDARGGGTGPLAAVGRIGIAIITPLQKGISAIVQPIGGFFANMFRAGSLAEENEALREQLAQASQRLNELNVLTAENARWESLFQLFEDIDIAERFGAEVIGYGPSNLEWSIVVDRGSGSDAADDMPVVASTGIPGLVGRVVQVTPASSIVQLLIDPNFGAYARLVQSRETGLLRGRGELDLEFELTDRNLRRPIQVGEPVETAGYTTRTGEVGIFPSGIPIGKVSQVETNPSTGRTVVYVRPYVDFSKLEDVVLVSPVQPAPDAAAPSRTP